MTRLSSAFLTLLVLLWSFFCCSLALVVTLASKKAIPWVLKGIGSDLWSKYILVLTGNGNMAVTHSSEHSQQHQIPSEAIFVSNHVSQLDINAASFAIPHPIVFLAKASIRKVPILGLLNERVGTVFIDRADKEGARKAVFRLKSTLERGISVLVFPEGTRSKSGAMGSFKKGAFHLAVQADVPIIPLHIHGTRKTLPSGSFWVRPNPIHVRFGAPIYPSECANNIGTLTESAKSAVESLGAWHVENVITPD